MNALTAPELWQSGECDIHFSGECDIQYSGECVIQYSFYYANITTHAFLLMKDI